MPRVCPATAEEKHYYKHGHIFSKFSLEDIVDMGIKLKIGDHNICIKNDSLNENNYSIFHIL